MPAAGPEWRAWREKALIWRLLARDRCDQDAAYRADLVALCAADPALDMILFGVVFEPRDRAGETRGWQPAIPYAFQVDLLRWIEEAFAVLPGSPQAALGRGDGVVEKARAMAGTWTFAIWACHHWRYQDAFTCGFMSYKQDLVDKQNVPGTIFAKMRAYLGVDEKVPASQPMRIGGAERQMPVRPPAWLTPEGWSERKHSATLVLAHPSRTNVITGYSTTGKATTGDRLGALVLDEGAKFEAFPVAWQNASAVTDHRFALSSADLRYGSGFRDLAKTAERAQQHGAAGPAFLRLLPALHPERDEVWAGDIAARHAGNEEAEAALAREYYLDYEAGSGVHIYPGANAIEPAALAFSPANESLDFCIDPGVAAMCAINLVKYDPGLGRYGLMASYVNNSQPAEFYATLLCGAPLYNKYAYGEEETRMMSEWFVPHGRRIRFFVGDSAGNVRGGGNLSTFYGDFREAVHRLSDGRWAMSIWSSNEDLFRHNKPRWDALRWMLQRLDVNDAPDTRRTLEAIRDHRLPADRDDREITTARNQPVRTWGHDRVTALEFYAAHRKNWTRLKENAAAAPTPARYTMGGKPITAKPSSSTRHAAWGERRQK